MISAEISDGKKAETAQAAAVYVRSNTTQRAKKAEARTKKPHGKNMRRKGRKTLQAEKPCGSAAGKQDIRNAMPHTYNIYSAQRAENSEQEIILV